MEEKRAARNPKERWHLDSGPAAQEFGPRQYRHWEDGNICLEWPEGHVVRLWNDYGHEYYHHHTFDTPEQAERFVAIVQRHLDSGKQPNLEHWHYHRVMYGTQAYLDEEPYIVERERQDAISGADVFDINCIPIGGYRYDD